MTNLGESFLRIAHQLRRDFRRQYEPWGLAPHQVRALRMIHRHGPLRLGALAEQLRIAARSATDVVDQLAQRDLVERRADPLDGRAVVVAVTPAGQEMAEQTERVRIAVADAYFDRLDPADRAELARILADLDQTPSDGAS